jgi:hypothetical protein
MLHCRGHSLRVPPQQSPDQGNSQADRYPRQSSGDDPLLALLFREATLVPGRLHSSFLGLTQAAAFGPSKAIDSIGVLKADPFYRLISTRSTQASATDLTKERIIAAASQ